MRLLTFFFLSALSLSAQRPAPAPAQRAPVLIYGATAHIGNGNVIANSVVAFENGKLTLVADATTVRIDRTRYSRIFDATGKHVYPGLIATNSHLGLVEIEAARPTVDYADAGAYNPNLRAIVAYNTDSDVIPTVRSNGVLLAQAAPSGGTISGTACLVQLDAWNWEDAAKKTEAGIYLNWPALRTFSGFFGGGEARKNENYDKEIAEMRRFFEEARAYAQQAAPEVQNLKFEAMRGLFGGAQKLFVRADNAKTIREAVLFAKSFEVKMVLVGGEDAWLAADLLKEYNVPVILGPTHSLPSRDDADVDQTFKTAAQLKEKGVLFAIAHPGAWQQRNLPFLAGHAAGFGLDKESALGAVTLNSAKILGIDDQYGSLEEGKNACLFISEGDALDMRTNQVTAAFIDGREINLDNKQKQLYRRFEEKYRQ